MTENSEVPTPTRPALRRPADGAVLGGVCAALAEHFGLDVVLVRLVTVAVLLLSGGTAVLAYLAAWVLIPAAARTIATTTATTTEQPPSGNPQAAWRAAGEELRTLGTALRPARKDGAASPAAGPLEAVDSALTGFGERLRDPEVQQQARRAASGVSAAVGTSLNGRGRTAGAGPADDGTKR